MYTMCMCRYGTEWVSFLVFFKYPYICFIHLNNKDSAILVISWKDGQSPSLKTTIQLPFTPIVIEYNPNADLIYLLGNADSLKNSTSKYGYK